MECDVALLLVLVLDSFDAVDDWVSDEVDERFDDETELPCPDSFDVFCCRFLSSSVTSSSSSFVTTSSLKRNSRSTKELSKAFFSKKKCKCNDYRKSLLENSTLYLTKDYDVLIKKKIFC